MTYLDVNPMISALRSHPEQFAGKNGDRLTHLPSRHHFRFYPDKHVSMSAHCDCASLSIREDQQAELSDAFQHWYSSYWRPLKINEEFAAHFAPPSLIRRFLIAITGKLHQALIAGRALDLGGSEVLSPAE
jgi:hypothetical protein